MNKRFLWMLITMLVMFSSCREMFSTDPDDIINRQDYISQDDEMYKGFLGIMTRMQEAADHSIILTDTRGDYFQTTDNAPLDLQKIYRYEKTDGNTYADPAPYYAVVIACNDYIDKMKQYRAKVGDEMDSNAITHFKALISSTIRLKVWAYLKLGKCATWRQVAATKFIKLGWFTGLLVCPTCHCVRSA